MCIPGVVKETGRLFATGKWPRRLKEPSVSLNQTPRLSDSYLVIYCGIQVTKLLQANYYGVVLQEAIAVNKSVGLCVSARRYTLERISAKCLVHNASIPQNQKLFQIAYCMFDTFVCV